MPFWAKDGGPERLMAALRDPDDRARMARELAPSRLENNWLTNFTQPQNRRYDGRLLTDIAEMRNQDPAEALFDLLIEENLGISTVGLGTNAHTLHAFVSHPAGMIASDAILFGEYPNPRTYGCFPIVLAEFVRAERHLRLPEAIRKMTSFPAQRLGLPDRGILRDGFKADIVIFDADTVKTHATREDPHHYPVGIDYVIVNGVVVVDDGENTGATPGRGLRRGRGGALNTQCFYLQDMIVRQPINEIWQFRRPTFGPSSSCMMYHTGRLTAVITVPMTRTAMFVARCPRQGLPLSDALTQQVGGARYSDSTVRSWSTYAQQRRLARSGPA